MTDYADVLERELARLHPRRIPFERLHRRKDRKQRNRRIGAGVLAIVIAAGAIGLVSKALRWVQPIPGGLPDHPSAWVRHDLAPDELTHNSSGITSVTQGGPGLVAAGQSDGREHHNGYIIDGPASVWISSDGTSWTRLLGCASEDVGCNSHGIANTVDVGDELGTGVIHDVVAGGPGLVAVGGSGRSPDAGHTGSDSQTGVVWTSPDGGTWARVPSDSKTFGSSFMNAVASGSSGNVSVGWTYTPSGGPVDGTPWETSDGTWTGRPAAWFSADGTMWTRASFEGSDQPGFVNDVTTFAGGYVAVGADDTGDNWMPNDGLIWTSTDGRSWTRVAAGSVTKGVDLEAVTDGPHGLVAVGSVLGRTFGNVPSKVPAVLTSTDGTHWTRVDPSGQAFALPASYRSGSAWMKSVAATPAGYVAVGGQWECSNNTNPDTCAGGVVWSTVVWISPDDRTWVRVGELQGSDLSGVVTRWGSRFVVVGRRSQSPTDPTLAFTGSAWVSR